MIVTPLVCVWRSDAYKITATIIIHANINAVTRWHGWLMWVDEDVREGGFHDTQSDES